MKIETVGADADWKTLVEPQLEQVATVRDPDCATTARVEIVPERCETPRFESQKTWIGWTTSWGAGRMVDAWRRAVEAHEREAHIVFGEKR